MRPGIYNLSFEDYCRLDAINNSTLTDLARSPAHARYRALHPEEPTDAQRLGQAVHSAILEPDDFETVYVSMPHFGDMRTKAAKIAKAEWEMKNADKAQLTAKEFDLCQNLRDAAWSNPDMRQLLEAKGRNEVTVLWEDPGTGLQCKARIDGLREYGVFDIKTTRNASSWAFGQDIGKYGYHRQAAYYLRGLDVLAPHDRRFIFIALEKEPPYCTAIYEPTQDALLRAGDQVNDLLHTYKECVDKGNWPGYPRGIQLAQIPEWALNRRFGDG